METRWHAALAEGVGTAALVLVGCGAIALDALELMPLGTLGIALAFGATVALVIATLGAVSGAHINPAVTVALWSRGRITAAMGLSYLAAQFVGAVLAAMTLRLWVPATALGVTHPAPGVPMWALVVMELIATGVLAAVILFVATGPVSRRRFAPFAVGGTVALAAATIGPLTGASLNPARSLGPAVAALDWVHLGWYLLVPTLGALVGAFLACRALPAPQCCAPEVPPTPEASV